MAPGVADTLGRVGEAGLTNVRLLSVDAVWSIEHLVEPGGLAGLWTFFPDPWHKTRHHKRRLVTPVVRRPGGRSGSRPAPSGGWPPTGPTTPSRWSRCSTPSRCSTGGVVERWAERPVTKFERKGLAAGRDITDLAYVRA